VTKCVGGRASAAGISIGLGLFFNSYAQAIDLSGNWASEVEACDKLFVGKGKTTSFRKNSDLHGSGFIIQGGRIKGRMAGCKITKTQVTEPVVHMVASCATDIMFSHVQFSVRVLNDNKINRIFPGFDEMEMTFYRCPSTTEKSAPISR
jgi:hypothetical protein